MSRVINFGDKKEAYEQMKWLAGLVHKSSNDKMIKRYHIAQALQTHARDFAKKFDLYVNEKELSTFITEFVNSFFIEAPGMCDLFEDVEIDMMKRAMLQTLQAEQIWIGIREQVWRQI